MYHVMQATLDACIDAFEKHLQADQEKCPHAQRHLLALLQNKFETIILPVVANAGNGHSVLEHYAAPKSLRALEQRLDRVLYEGDCLVDADLVETNSSLDMYGNDHIVVKAILRHAIENADLAAKQEHAKHVPVKERRGTPKPKDISARSKPASDGQSFRRR